MSRKDEYQAYLRSDNWRKLSLLARLRAGNACELCGGSGDHVHHVKYPKRFSEDSLDNLLVVCEYHHSLLHGIRGEIMSGDCMLIEGIEVIQDKDGVCWLDFEGLFSKVWSSQDGSIVYGSVSYSNTLNGVFSQIREKWKKIERFQLQGGVYRLRYLVTKQGATQFAASYKHHKMEPFQDWLFDTVLPQIESTGSYAGAPKLTGDPNVDYAIQVREQANLIVQALIEQKEIKEKLEKHEEIINDHIQKFDNMTGGNYSLTARQALLRMGVNPESIYRGSQTMAMALGAYAAKWHREHNVPVPPKIPEGTYMVGQYSRDALRDGVKSLGISVKQVIH